MRLKLFVLVLISAVVVFRISYNITQKNEIILPKNYVNDWADIVTVDGVFELDNRLSAMDQKTGIRMAIVTLLPGEDGISNFEYSERVFPLWNQTLKDPDSGILLIVSIKEGKVTLEAGAKLKYLLDKEFQETALSKTLIPELLKGPTKCDKGFIQLITLVEEKVEKYYQDNKSIEATLKEHPSSFDLYRFFFEGKRILIFACVLFLIIVLVLLKFKQKFRCPLCGGKTIASKQGKTMEFNCPECGYMKKETV